MDKLSWHTIEHHYTEKTADWYWIVAIVSISIAIISIIMNNIIFAILILVASFTLSLFASKKPGVIEVTINGQGVIIGRTKYPYVNLDSFWVEDIPNHEKLIIKSKKLFSPFIIAFIDEVHPDEVRQAMLKHLREEEHTEPLLEKLLIRLGF